MQQQQQQQQPPQSPPHPHQQPPLNTSVRNPREGGVRSHSLTSMNGIRINMDSNGWHCSVDESQGPTWDATLLPPDIVPEYLPDIFDQLHSDENDGYIIWNTTPSEPMTPGPLSVGYTAAQTTSSVPVTSASSSSSAGTSHPVGSSSLNHDKGSSSSKRWSVGDQFKSKDLSIAATTDNTNRTSGDGHGLSVQIPGSASLKSSENAPPPTPPPSSSNHRPGFRGKSGSEALLSLGTSKSADTTGAVAGGTSGGSGSAPESTEDRILMAATVEKLVEKLTSVIGNVDDYYTFLTDFFLIYRLFITPLALLKLLILRFHWALLDDTPERQIVRIRTFVTLRHWLLNYFGHDFMTSKELRSTLTLYLNSLPNHPRIAASPRDQRIVKELKKYTQSLKKIHYRNIAQLRLERKSRRALLRQHAAASGTAQQRRSKLSRAERARLTQSMSTTDDLMPTSSTWVDHPEGGDYQRRRSKAEKRKMGIQMSTTPLQSPTQDGAGDFPHSTAESARSSSGINDAASVGRQSRASEPMTEELSVDFRSSEQEDDDEEEEEDEDEVDLDDTSDEDDEIESSSEQSQSMSDSMDSMDESEQDEEHVRQQRQRQEESLQGEDGLDDEEENDPPSSQFQHQYRQEPAFSSTPVEPHGGFHPSSPTYSPAAAAKRRDSSGGLDSFSSRSISYRNSRPGIPSFDSPSQQQQQRAANRVSTAWSRAMRIHTHESTASLRDRRTNVSVLTQDPMAPSSSLHPSGSHSYHYQEGSHLYLLPSAGSQGSAMDSVRSVEPYMNPPPRAHTHSEKKKTWARYMSATVGRLNKMKRALTSGSLSSSHHKNENGGFGATSNSSTSSRYRNGGGGSFKDSITEPATSSASQARLFKHLQSQYSDLDNDKVTRTHYFLGSCSAIQFSSSSSSPNQFMRSSGAAAAAAGSHSRQHGGGGGMGSGQQRAHDGGLWSSDEEYSQYEMTNHSRSLRSTSSSHRRHHQHGYGNQDQSVHDESSIDREGSSLHSHYSRPWQQQVSTPDANYLDSFVNERYDGDDCSECERQQQQQQQQYPYQSHLYGQDDGTETGLVQSTSAPAIVRSDDEVDYQIHRRHGDEEPRGAQQQHDEDLQRSKVGEDGNEYKDPFHDRYSQRRHSLDDPRRRSTDLAESGDHVEEVLQSPPTLPRAGLGSHRLRRTTRGRPRDSRRASWRTLSSTNSSMFGALLSEDHRPPGQTVLERMQDPTVGNIDKFVEKLNLGQGFFSPPESSTGGNFVPTATHAPQDPLDGCHPYQQGPSVAGVETPQRMDVEEDGDAIVEQAPVPASPKLQQPTRRRSSWILDNILMHHSLSSKESTETITSAKVASSAKRNSTPSKMATTTTATSGLAKDPPRSPSSGHQTMTRTQKRQTMPIPLLYQHRHRNEFVHSGEPVDGRISSSGWYSQQQQQPSQQQHQQQSSSVSSGPILKMVPDTATLRPVTPAHAPMAPLQGLPEHLTLRQVLSMHPEDLRQDNSTPPPPMIPTQASQLSQALRLKPSSPLMGTMPDGPSMQGQGQMQQQQQHHQSSSASTPTPLKRPTAGQKRSVSQPYLLAKSQLASGAANTDGSATMPSRHSHHPSMPVQGSSGSWSFQPPHPHQHGAAAASAAAGSGGGPTSRREYPPSTPLYHQPSAAPVMTATVTTTEHYRHQRYNYHRYDPRTAPPPPGHPHHHLAPPSLANHPQQTTPPLLPCPAFIAPTPAPRAPTSFVLRYRTELIAQQLCLIERELLNNVQWYELVDAGWTRKSSPPPRSSAASASASTTSPPPPPVARASSVPGTSRAGGGSATKVDQAPASGVASSSSSMSSTRKQKRGSQPQPQASPQVQRGERQKRNAYRMPTRSLSSATTATTASSSSNAALQGSSAGGGAGQGGLVDEDDEETPTAVAAKRYARTRKRSASEGGLVVRGSRGTASGHASSERRMSGMAPLETATTPTVPTTVMALSIAPIRSRRHPKNPSEESQGIKALIDRFNLTCQWVTTEILNTRDLNERVRVVEKFIRIAQTCYNHSNFSSLIQLILGLQSHNVSRLTQTWARVRPKEILMMQDLIEFTSPFNNWKHLRDTMKNIADEWGGSGAGAAAAAATATTGASTPSDMPSSSTAANATASQGRDGRRTKSHRGFFGMKTGGGGSSGGTGAHDGGKASAMIDTTASASASQDKGGEERTVKQGGCIPFLGLYLSDLVYNTELPSYVEPRGPPVHLAMAKPLPAAPRPLSTSATAAAVIANDRGFPTTTASSACGMVGGGAAAAAAASSLPTPLNSPMFQSPPNSAPIQTWTGAAVAATAATATAATTAAAAAALRGGAPMVAAENDDAKSATLPLPPPPPPPPPTPPKLINFHKHRTTATIIKRVLTFRTIAARYPFRQEPEVYAQLLAIRGMDSTEMERASLLCEERVSDAGRAV
ncbi:hypothetical protein BGZ73_007110 [Actinomortierella ambigua]|nr:hypothetical protein BGZ73_007110 [Actinomortierella ambigua]